MGGDTLKRYVPSLAETWANAIRGRFAFEDLELFRDDLMARRQNAWMPERLAACEEPFQLRLNWRKSLCDIGEVVVKKERQFLGSEARLAMLN